MESEHCNLKLKRNFEKTETLSAFFQSRLFEFAILGPFLVEVKWPQEKPLKIFHEKNCSLFEKPLKKIEKIFSWKMRKNSNERNLMLFEKFRDHGSDLVELWMAFGLKNFRMKKLLVGWSFFEINDESTFGSGPQDQNPLLIGKIQYPSENLAKKELKKIVKFLSKSVGKIEENGEKSDIIGRLGSPASQ